MFSVERNIKHIRNSYLVIIITPEAFFVSGVISYFPIVAFVLRMASLSL